MKPNCLGYMTHWLFILNHITCLYYDVYYEFIHEILHGCFILFKWFYMSFIPMCFIQWKYRNQPCSITNIQKTFFFHLLGSEKQKQTYWGICIMRYLPVSNQMFRIRLCIIKYHVHRLSMIWHRVIQNMWLWGVDWGRHSHIWSSLGCFSCQY